MTLGQPWGKFSVRGRPASARMADIRHLDELAGFMLRAPLRNAVQRFLAQNPSEAGYFRKLRRLLKHLPKRAVSDAVDIAAVKRQLSTGVIPRELVEEEAHLAAQELVRHWVDSLRLAWEGWGEVAESIFLDSNIFYPLPPEGSERRMSAWKTWDADNNESLDILLSSVALTADDIPAVMHEFGREVMGYLEKNQTLDLPDGLCITLVGARAALSTHR